MPVLIYGHETLGDQLLKERHHKGSCLCMKQIDNYCLHVYKI